MGGDTIPEDAKSISGGRLPMIEVSVKRDCISVLGHSGYAPHGQDILSPEYPHCHRA